MKVCKKKLFSILFIFFSINVFAKSSDLQIHYINVGQGGSTLIIGPNGTKILYDFGRVSGRKYIVPYLKERLKLQPEKGIDYAILSHADKDHYMGYRDIVSQEFGGFNILKANYEPGTSKQSKTLKKYLFDPAKDENIKAGAFRPIPLGLLIDLGNGAKAIVVAANGNVLGDDPFEKNNRSINENDRSISLFIKYDKYKRPQFSALTTLPSFLFTKFVYFS